MSGENLFATAAAPRPPRATRRSARRWATGRVATVAGIGVLAALSAVYAPSSAQTQSPPLTSPSGVACLDPMLDTVAAPPLAVELISTAPVEICEAHLQVVEIRNRSDAPLGMGRLMLEPPLGPGKLRFLPRPGETQPLVEASRDDGATWESVGAPTGRGDERDPLVWSELEAAALSRLGPLGAPDDSVLFRWRAALGDAYGDPFEASPRLVLRGDAVDACGRRVASPLRSARIPLLRPDLRVRLSGRNASRGGQFSDHVRAAPGDRIEWRLAVENAGDGRAETGLVRVSDAEEMEIGAATLDPISAGGRRVITIEQTAGQSCRAAPIRAAASWGCAAPMGSPDGVPPGIAGVGRAMLDMQVDASDLTVSQTVRDRAGADRPGAAADVTIDIVNRGAPVFEPEVEVVLPDGYALDSARPPALYVGAGRARVVQVASESPGRAAFRFLAPEGDAEAVALDPDSELSLKFGIRRARPSLLARDDLETVLRGEDGCGSPVLARPARMAVETRRPELDIGMEILGSPLVSGPDQTVRFVARVDNRGDDVARDPFVQLALGSGWRGEAIEGCVAEAETEPSQVGRPDNSMRRRYRCALGRDLGPGDQAELLVDLVSGIEPRAGLPLPDALAVEAEARHAGPAAPAGLDRARTRADAIGFYLGQRLLTEAGAERDPDAPMDLGERALIEIEAMWFAGGSASVEDAALTQALPSALKLLRFEAVEIEDLPENAAQPQIAGVLSPPVGGGGRLHVSLSPFATPGLFRAHALVEAVEPGRPTSAGARRSVEALASFTRDGVSYGVDQAQDPRASARSLPLTFRRPALRAWLAREPGRPETAAQPGLTLDRGMREALWLGVENQGAGPGFVDWLTLETPPGVIIEPSETDGLDNDGDGAVDEPDEAAIAPPEAIDGGGERRRWTLRVGAASSASAGRLDPGSRIRWPIALRLADDVQPGEIRDATLVANVGARPLAERAADRRRLQEKVPLTARPFSGFLTLSEAEPKRGPNRGLRHGDRVRYRISLTPPPGGVRDLTLRFDAGPALSDLRPVGAQRGVALACLGGAEPQTVTSDTGSAVEWRLGDCAEGAGMTGAGAAVIDVVGTVSDAPPGADTDARTAWRKSLLSATALWRGEGADGVETDFAETIAQGFLAVDGPAPNAIVALADGDALPPRVDAGDRFTASVTLENRGDVAMPAPRLTLPSEPWIECGVLEAHVVDAPGDRAEGCGAALNMAALAPGERRIVTLRGQIAGSAGSGAPPPPGEAPALSAALRFEDAEETARPADGALTLPWRLPTTPRISIEAQDAVSAALASPGSVLRLMVDSDIPETSDPVSLQLAVRLLNSDGAPADPADALAALRLLDIQRIGAANEGATAAAWESAEAVLSPSPEGEGWLTVSAPFGPRDAAQPAKDGSASRLVSLQAALGLEDSPALRAGRRLEVRATAVAGGLKSRSEPEATTIVEPFLDLAARVFALPDPHLEARICNRGAAPAYGVALTLTPPAPARFLSARLTRADEPAPDGLAPPSIGSVSRGASGVYQVNSGASALAPGRCFQLDAPLESAALALGPTAKATPVRIALTGYRAAESATQPGRAYASDLVATAAAPPPSLRLSGPGRAAPRGAGAALRFEAAFTVSAPAALGPLDLALSAASDPELVWTLYRDLDGDGLRDAGEPRLDGGRTRLEPGASGRSGGLQSASFLAVASAPRGGVSEGWRGLLHLQAIGIAQNGAAPRGVMAVALAAAPESGAVIDALALAEGDAPPPPGQSADALHGLVARRLMAVDRDCDGARDDELGQDALFETAKSAAPGECVIMRLEFENHGSVAVEDVSIEDRPPSASRYVEASARFASTPSGLIEGVIEEPMARSTPDSGAPAVRFGFIGALAPGRRGAVEYRVRLGDG